MLTKANIKTSTTYYFSYNILIILEILYFLLFLITKKEMVAFSCATLILVNLLHYY